MSFPYKYKPSYNPKAFHTQVEFYDYLAKLQEMQQWLHDQKWDHWGYEKGVFMFSFEQDYALFLLKWS